MNAQIGEYAEYKDSGVVWLGRVPARWELAPGKIAFREKNHPNTGMKEQTVLSLSYGRVVVKDPEKLHGLVPDSFETYQVLDPGDIVIRGTDLQNDQVSLRVGQAKNRGIITSAYIALETLPAILPKYAYRYLSSCDTTKVFYGLGTGLRQNLSFKDFKNLPTLIPSLDEQAAIVKYLAHVDRKIDRFIRAQRRMIELLHEQKQAIIHQAATRGLDPSVPMKDSGVEWLGEIPAHWEMRRVKNLVNQIDQGVSPQAEAGLADSGSWGVLKSGCVNRGVFRDTEHKRLPPEFPIDAAIVVHVGDVLVSRASGSPALVGSIGKVDDCRFNLILSDKTFRLKLKDTRLSGFIVLVGGTRYFREQVEQSISGAEGLANNLPLTALKRFRVALPPIQDVESILNFISSEVSDLDGAIERYSQEIDLIREYRTRLISDVVTGKVDVRAVAASLPEFEDAVLPNGWDDEFEPNGHEGAIEIDEDE